MESNDKRFCVALRAVDTGRVARVGTVMELDDADVQYEEETIRRIVVKCRATGIVEISSVLNPSAASRENRLRGSPVYLKARVHRRDEAFIEQQQREGLVEGILKDYEGIRETLVSTTSSDAGIFPEHVIHDVQRTLPVWEDGDFGSDRLWTTLESWQMLSNTVREWLMVSLSAERNEFMVEAMVRDGGMLNLPIHPSDLTPTDRLVVEVLESRAQQEFLELGMDPVLDCQVLLSVPSRQERIAFLARTLSRVRKALKGRTQ